MSHHVYNIVRWRAFPVPSLFALPIGAQKILQLKDDWREFGKAEKGHEDTNVGASKDDGAKTISAWLWWSAPMGIKYISKYRCGRRINNYTGRLGRQERKYILGQYRRSCVHRFARIGWRPQNAQRLPEDCGQDDGEGHQREPNLPPNRFGAGE